MSSNDMMFSTIFAGSTRDADNQPGVPTGGNPPQKSPPSFTDMFSGMAPIALIVIVFFWMMSRSNKRRQNARNDLLSAIRPKDDVVTIGGVHGRVVQVSEETIVLCIDSDRGTRMTFTRSAVSRKLGDEEEK